MEDAPALNAVLSNEAAMAYWSTPPHATIDETTAWVRSMLEAGRTGQSEDDLVLEWNGVVVGKAGFWRAPELGFILHPSAQGRGLAAEALTLLLERAFAVRFYARATADVDPRNQRCLRLLNGLGFRPFDYREKTHQVSGQWYDSSFLELPADRWASQRAVTGTPTR